LAYQNGALRFANAPYRGTWLPGLATKEITAGFMYAAIRAIYENGQVILQEPPPVIERSEVIVLFMQHNPPQKTPAKGVKIGSLAGKGYRLPDNFNEPVTDLSEYS